jgi:hypothetical protein
VKNSVQYNPSYGQTARLVFSSVVRELVISFFLVISLAVQIAKGQADWKLMTERAGVKVYTKNNADEKIKSIKAQCVLNAGVERIVDLLMDVRATEKWVCHTKSCVLLRRVSAQEFYYYTEVSLPWPVSNRDFVTHATVSVDPITKVVTVNAPSVPGWVSPKKGVVRVYQSVGHWVLTPITADRTSVIYTLQVDPAGMVPAWIVNSFSYQAPVETFRNMKKLLHDRAIH